MVGLTSEEALKMQNETLKEQLKVTTDKLEEMNKREIKHRADEADRLIADITERSNFKPEDLANRTVEDLFLIQVSLDKAGATGKSAGIKKSVDERKSTNGLTAGRFDPSTKTWVGG